MSGPAVWADGNPFSTRHVRPGAIPYLFPAGESAAALVERLAAQGWRGEIVGPHGSGKSTLLAALAPALRGAGREVRLVELHDGQRRLPPGLAGDARLDGRAVLVVDGYEQLSVWGRRRLSGLCRRRGCGLLVTTHAPTGLPLLFQAAPTAESAQQIVHHLLPADSPLLAAAEIDAAFQRHQGDVREMLFELYDLYEHRVGAGGTD